MRPADVISGKAGIEGVRRMLVGAEAQRSVARAIETLLEDGASVEACELYRAKFKPGRKLSAWYVVHVVGPRRRARRHAAVTWESELIDGKEPSQDALARLQEEASRRGLVAPFRSLHLWAADRRMRVLVSPLDVRFPALVRLADPSYAAGLLQEPADPPPKVSVVRYRPGERHVLRYDLASASGPPRPPVYAKLYAEAGAADAVWRRSSAVSGALADADVGLGAAAPCRLLSGDHAVLYRGVSATPLPLSARSTARCGAALRCLHVLPPTLLPPRAAAGFEEEAAAVVRAAAHIDVLLPDAAGSLRASLDRAVELGRPGEAEPAVVHGDCKLAHVLASATGDLVLIDLDRCHRGDAALDLGKLAADLRFHRVVAGRAGAEDAVHALFAAYGDTPGAGRARAYEALLMLKIAARRVPLFDRRWADTTRAVVAAAAAVLEQPHRRRGRPRVGVAS